MHVRKIKIYGARRAVVISLFGEERCCEGNGDNEKSSRHWQEKARFLGTQHRIYEERRCTRYREDLHKIDI